MKPIDVSKFWVISVISNPARYRSRYELYKKFEEHVISSGANLLTVELGFGQRPHEVTDSTNRQHLQLQSYDELWHKENMINVAIQRLTSRIAPDAEYIAWVDADIEFIRKDWVQETVQQLQHYMIVQMFEDAVDMTPSKGILQTNKGFAWCWHENKFVPDNGYFVNNSYYYQGSKNGSKYYWHPGYAWAARREALDELSGFHGGPLIDYPCIIGAGDHHMALSLIGEGQRSMPPGMHSNYTKAIFDWQERAVKYVKKDIGFVPGTILHAWHGKKTNRKYWKRWDILRTNNYNPETDVRKDTQGLMKLVVENERQRLMRDQLRAYFKSRNEDGTDVE